MVSDSDLVTRLREILRTSDLDTATAGSVRRKLEEDFGLDLSNKAEKEGKKRGGGFTKLCSLSPQLQKFLGVSELARTEVVKKLWAYIRENNLQDPKNKRNIKCDEALHDLFRVNSINMFQMNKALSKHIWPLTAEAVLSQYKSYKVDKDVKKRGGGFTKLCSLSPQLQEFTGVPELARTEVVKKLWAYIREKDLQDPKNKRNIICDESLRALFRVDSINMFQMNKALSKHIWPLNEEDGENTLSRADVVKRMWEYIKQNDLQDPSDKRRIICDEKLKELFEVDSFNGFSVSKLLTAHFIKMEQSQGP
ncbi:hypothetical protein GH714_041946 [Hevea brasiliensis]|uniref:DM2 domain-containing protein n=1 Tax=Hevea brasiliensis TaxID=3981 RepID=A0A6A6MVI1_HEVBR|nr:hypothetical protein GH714_041946 [Hevea brasiliensis]